MPFEVNSISLLAAFLSVVVIGLHVVFALAIYFDACHIEAEDGGLMFVGPRVWAFAVLPFGMFAVLVYWLVHHSALRKIDYRPTSSKRD